MDAVERRMMIVGRAIQFTLRDKSIALGLHSGGMPPPAILVMGMKLTGPTYSSGGPWHTVGWLQRRFPRVRLVTFYRFRRRLLPAYTRLIQEGGAA